MGSSKNSVILGLLVSALFPFVTACSEQVQTVRVDMNYCADQTSEHCKSGVDGFQLWAQLYFDPNVNYEPHPDTFCAVTLIKKGAFNTMDLFLATDEEFKSSVFSNSSSGKEFYGERLTVGIGCLDSETKLYAKLCRHKADSLIGLPGAYDGCTQVHSFKLPDSKDDTTLTDGYRTPWVSYIAQTISKAKSAIGGLAIGYSCDTKELVAANTVAEGLYFTIDDPSNGTVYVKKGAKDGFLEPSGEKSYKVTIPQGTGLRVQVWASSWIGGVEDMITKKPASSIGYLTLSCSSDMEVIATSNVAETTIHLPTVKGVEATLYAGLLTPSGAQMSKDTIELVNGSSDYVCFQLYTLNTTSATGKYAWGFENGDKCVKSGETVIVDNITTPITSGSYAVIVRAYDWNNTNWSLNDVAGVTLTKGTSWSSSEIPDSSMPAKAP